MERELTTSQGTQPPAPGCPGPSKAALGTSRSDSRPSPHLCLPEISLPCPEQRSLVKPAALCPLLLYHPRFKFTGRGFSKHHRTALWSICSKERKPKKIKELQVQQIKALQGGQGPRARKSVPACRGGRCLPRPPG